MTNRTATIPPDRMLHPKDVALMFGVDIKTVRRWALEGKLPHVTTFGGHRRYPESEIRALMAHRSNGERLEP